MKKRKSGLPKGWTEKRVNALIRHYETQSEDEAAAEDQAAWNSTRTTMMAVPVELVPRVQKLITKRAG